MAETVTLWETLSEPWLVCLTLAWASYRHGPLPIAAVIVDKGGEIVARGRNRLRDDNGAANVLHHHQLARAEVNALLAFPFGARSASACTLLTTTEPCPLCVGTVRMAGIGRLEYASRDAWAGPSQMFGTVPFIRERGIRVTSLSGSTLETCLITPQTDAHLRVNRTKKDHLRFLEVWREVVPVGVATGEQLFASDRSLALAQSGSDVQEAVTVIEQVVAGAS